MRFELMVADEATLAFQASALDHYANPPKIIANPPLPKLNDSRKNSKWQRSAPRLEYRRPAIEARTKTEGRAPIRTAPADRLIEGPFWFYRDNWLEYQAGGNIYNNNRRESVAIQRQ